MIFHKFLLKWFLFNLQEKLPLSERCMMDGCKRRKMDASIYCSEDCIKKHAEESLEIIRKERGKMFGSNTEGKVKCSSCFRVYFIVIFCLIFSNNFYCSCRTCLLNELWFSRKMPTKFWRDRLLQRKVPSHSGFSNTPPSPSSNPEINRRVLPTCLRSVSAKTSYLRSATY